MFYELNPKEIEPSVKKKMLRAWRSLMVAVGRINEAQEEVRKIDSFGFIKNRRPKKVLTVDSEGEFIAAFKKGEVTSIEAQVYVTKDKSKQSLGAYSVFDHKVTFVAELPGLKIVQYPVSFDKHRSLGEIENLPIADTLALRTYITAGQSLINLKMGFPNIPTRLSTSNNGIIFDVVYYYAMVKTARKGKVHAWK